MHLPRLITFLLVLVAPPIFTEANEGSGSLPMAEVAGDPSGIVSGCVNAITGTYRKSNRRFFFIFEISNNYNYKKDYCYN